MSCSFVCKYKDKYNFTHISLNSLYARLSAHNLKKEMFNDSFSIRVQWTSDDFKVYLRFILWAVKSYPYA